MATSPLFPELTPTLTATATPDLFREIPKSVNAGSSNSTLVNAVITKGKNEKILGPKPKTSSGLDISHEKFPLGNYLFKMSILILIVTFGFFYTQLNPDFQLLGQNPIQRLNTFEEGLKTDQTDINFYNFMIAKFALDDFAISADNYLIKISQYESAYTPDNIRNDLEEDLTLLQADMKKSLTLVKDKLSHTTYPKALAFKTEISTLENEYSLALKGEINKRQQTLNSSKDPDTEIQQKNLESALALINAKDFQTEIKGLDLNKDLETSIVQHLFQGSTQISKNEFSTILSIKSERIHWSNILDELNRVTQEVDPLYGSGIKSNITYSTLTVNASDQTINLKGLTNTDDTKNFSLISDLVDKLEHSTMFMNVNDRSFNKIENTDKGFSASFNISLNLQYEADDRDNTTPISLNFEDKTSDLNLSETNPDTEQEQPSTPINIEPVDPFSSIGSVNFLDIFGLLTDAFNTPIQSTSSPSRIPRQ
ncbi:MAG: hypothetical protein UT55_C0031G0004 [Candidatus Peregrinibacteria bacterium GW2011_GWE2_39_6]|nr:MAG: hypothetical protein UT36_C0002G0031 [Candidatus Peregrinibacteria bacterium GW2011_GWF2_39_17]KKR25743.1 MAG: hypothetical protein UT55_C0031G0004 [Candidatus Peregrinibacteria bacterium GW2011_GWE2_39_6]HCW32136.1 hypothetical protein [Candidatus Peregrinibacteria bacterium]